MTYEVKTELGSDFFGRLEDAQVDYDYKTACYWYVLLIKHEPGQCDDILESTYPT